MRALTRALTCALTRPLPASSSAAAATTSAAAIGRYLDIRSMVERADELKANLSARGLSLNVDALCALAASDRALSTELSALRAERNAQARERRSASAAGLDLKARVAELAARASAVRAELLALALRVPNWSQPGTPIGDARAAQVLATSTRAIPADTAPVPRDHMRHVPSLLDFDSAAAVSGHGFVFLRNEAVALELALVQYALALASAAGFTPTLTPELVAPHVVARCGFAPRDAASQIYHVATAPDGPTELALIATSEIPLAGALIDKTLSPEQLPLRAVGFSHCFRAEAGAGGAAARGLYRLHQFSKVELFAATAPDDSQAAHAELLALSRRILDGLELPYRVLQMPTAELGAAAAAKLDIEAWMPSRAAWGEVASISNCTDFQARRLGLRYRPAPDAPLAFAHTLNGTALAVPRVMLALLENHAQPDGTVALPAALRPYMGGRASLSEPPSRPLRAAGK